MNCVVVMRVATSAVIAACELLYRNSGVIATYAQRAATSLPRFKWDGDAAKVELKTDDPNPNQQHDLPDVRRELEQIRNKLSAVGKVRITIEIEPTATNPPEASK